MELMNIREASKYLGITKDTLYGWVFRGVVGYHKIGRKILRFKKEDLDTLITSHPAKSLQQSPQDNRNTKRGRRSSGGVDVDRIIERAKKESTS